MLQRTSDYRPATPPRPPVGEGDFSHGIACRPIHVGEFLRNSRILSFGKTRLCASFGETLLRAFTLFELLLVLALIVVMGGIIVPALSGSFVHTKLNSAADDVQSAWAEARLEAIQRGQPVAFRCLVGGTEYNTTLYFPGIESEPTGDTDQTEENSEDSLPSGTIDEDLKFSEAISANALDGGDPGLRKNMRESSEWSAPVIFYPDGLSSDALIRIAHKDGRGIAVSLRGLTGIGRKGDVGPSGIPVEKER